jgi:hypothetical protein
VAIYTVNGMMIGHYPQASDIAVNLPPGLYMVQSGRYAAKLPVVGSGTGSTAAVREQPQTGSQVFSSAPPPVLRAGSSIRIYWNIKVGNNILSMEIPDVVSFRFTAEHTIVFSLKNGNTIELEDYQGIEFSIEPVPPTTNSKWDMEKTFKSGGATYGADFFSSGHDHVTYTSVTAVTNDYVIAYLIFLDFNIKLEKKDITYSNFWNIEGKLSCVYENAGIITMSAERYDIWGNKNISFYTYTNPYKGYDQDAAGHGSYGIPVARYPGETNIIPTTFKLTGANLTAIFVVNGRTYTYTFP